MYFEVEEEELGAVQETHPFAELDDNVKTNKDMINSCIQYM
jgi:hypothetical protein